jgi:hypothetical protein
MCSSYLLRSGEILRNIKVNAIIKALSIFCLTFVGLPEQFSQMRIQLYFSFISAMYASIKLNTKHFKSNESRGIWAGVEAQECFDSVSS